MGELNTKGVFINSDFTDAVKILLRKSKTIYINDKGIIILTLSRLENPRYVKKNQTSTLAMEYGE